MRLGRIRREALRLMFASQGDVLETATFAELYQNPQYALYLAGMEMSVNRALSRMQTAGALPVGRQVLEGAAVTGSVATFNLGAIDDFESVVGLFAATRDTYAAHAYRWEGGTTLVVPLYSPDETYVLLYRRTVAVLPPMCADDVEVDVPEALGCLIPYFIKSELYEEEDSIAAERARRYFDDGLKRYVADLSHDLPRMHHKYSWEEL